MLAVGAVGGGELSAFLKDLRRELGPHVPIRDLSYPVGTRSLQRALDGLTAEKALKIAVVPLDLASESPELEHLRYLLGVSEFPSSAYLESWRMSGRTIPRARTKTPIAAARALDDDPVAAEILLDRARALSRRPSEETVVVVGWGRGDDADGARRERLEGFAARLRRDGGFRDARGHLLLPPAAPPAEVRLGTRAAPKDPEGESRRALRETVRDLSKRGRVLVLPYLLARDGRERELKKLMEGLFCRYDGKPLLPDPRLARWAAERARQAAREEDMARHKDAGRAPPTDRKRFIQ